MFNLFHAPGRPITLLSDAALDTWLAGGIPGQPDPDTPEQPGVPNQPVEPGEPTIPDQPPPAPVACYRGH